MEITVTIPDEVVETAQLRGLTPRRYVENLLTQNGSIRLVPGEEKTVEERTADLKRFFEGMSRYSHKVPHLPNEVLTRESFYSDGD